jgi:hypothetical protein
MFNTIVGAGAATRYGSGSDQMIRLLAAPAPEQSLNVSFFMKTWNCISLWQKMLTLSLDLYPDPHSPKRLDSDPDPHTMNADLKHWEKERLTAIFVQKITNSTGTIAINLFYEANYFQRLVTLFTVHLQ